MSMDFYLKTKTMMKDMTDEEWRRIDSSIDYDEINGMYVRGELTVMLIKLMEEKYGAECRHWDYEKECEC